MLYIFNIHSSIYVKPIGIYIYIYIGILLGYIFWDLLNKSMIFVIYPSIYPSKILLQLLDLVFLKLGISITHADRPTIFMYKTRSLFAKQYKYNQKHDEDLKVAMLFH